MDDLQITNALKMAVEGDKPAFTYIYNQTCQELYRFAFSLCRSHDVTEDLLQETYIDAFVKLNELYTTQGLIRWLKGILINEWREYVRREKRAPMLSFNGGVDTDDEFSTEFSTLQDYVEKNETDDEIWRTVNLLSENQRICVLLFYYNDMSMEEISELLKIPLGSVKSRLHYGRNKLAKMLNKNNLFFNSAVPMTFGGSQELLAQILQALEVVSDSSGTKIIAGSTIGGILLKVSTVVILTAASVGGIAWSLNEHGQILPNDGILWITASTPSITSVSTTVTTSAATATTATSDESSEETTTVTRAATVTFDIKEISGGVAIAKYTGNSTSVNIPKKIDGKTVVAVADGAFENNCNLRSVSIPSTVQTIESNAFRGCRSLSKLSIARGVNSIGEAAFLGCTSLKSVVIPASVKTVGFYAFAYCTSLKEVKLNEGTEVLNYRTFIGCEKLSRITLPPTISVIGEAAFADTSPDLLLRVNDGSYSHQYAVENGFSFELI